MTHSTILTLSALMAISMLATSCGPKETATLSDDTIDLTPAFESGDTVNFYDILDTAYVIRLETSDECLIGSASYRVLDKYICVSRRNSSTPILFFDRNGKFVNSIKEGNGPGELQDTYSLRIVDDKKRNRIIVQNMDQLKYYDYDLKYTGSSKLPYYGYGGFGVAADNYVLWVSFYNPGKPEWGEFTDCNLLIIDTNMNILDGYVHYKLHWTGPTPPHTPVNPFLGGSFVQGNDYVFFQEVQWDTLFVYDTAFHALAVNYPNKANINIEEINNDNMYAFKNGEKNNYIERIMNFENYILFIINPAGWVLYSTSTKKSVFIKPFPYSYAYRFGNCAVEPFDYEDLERCKDSDEAKLPELKRVLSESDYAKLESLTEDDNPVLIFYQLKKTLE